MDRILPSGAAIFFKNIYLLLRSATGFFIRMLKTKNMTKKLGGLKRTEISKDHIMLMTYHPVFDMTLADQGIFKNSHYTSLQESLESNNQKLVWIALYLKHPLISHNRMLEYTEKFIKNDYPIYLLDEFCSVKSYLLAFLRIISSGLKFLFYEKAIAKAHDLGEYNIYSFLRNDWYSSFCGSAGYSTILYYEMFKSLFMSAGSKKCFFPSEMQSWEKALISARDYLKKDLYLIAHQSGTIARMLLICFNYPTEFRRDCAYPMPLPEKMACNGRVTYSYMKESGWPEDNLGIVEAIRYDYLKQHLGLKWDKKRKVVLILFSISAHESSAILNMAYHALRELEGIEVWLRPHPFLRIEDVLRNSSFDREEIPFKFKNGPIAESFREARIVIGGESGTCVEALAFGCKVIIVNSPEWINMSPLAQEKSDVIKKVSSVGELRKVVKETVSEKYEPEYVKPEPLRIINDFFYLDPASNIPSRILGLLKGER